MELPKPTFISLGFTSQLSTWGNVLLKIEQSYPFCDGSRKDLLASYGIIKESVSRNLGHDSGKCSCTRFVLNMCSAGISCTVASWGGGMASAFILGAGRWGCATTTAPHSSCPMHRGASQHVSLRWQNGAKIWIFFSMPRTLFPCHAQSVHLAAAGLGLSLAQKGFLQARWWQRSAGLYASGEALSQIAFLQCGCSFKFITSASFCLRTGGSALGENNLIDFLVSANPELSCDLLTTTGLLFLIFGIVLRGFCLLAA